MHKKVQSMFDISKIVSTIIIHVLDLLLLLVLLPFMVWKWISARHHITAILRAIIEVSSIIIIKYYGNIKNIKCNCYFLFFLIL